MIWRPLCHGARGPTLLPVMEAAPGLDLLQSPRAARAYAARKRNVSARTAGDSSDDRGNHGAAAGGLRLLFFFLL